MAFWQENVPFIKVTIIEAKNTTWFQPYFDIYSQQHYHPFCWILDLITMLTFLILVSSYFKYIRGCLQYKSLQDGGVDGPTGDVHRKSNI